MSVDAERVAAVRERVALLKDSELVALDSLAAVIAYTFTAAKAEGRNGLDDVELTLAAIAEPRTRADRRRWDSLRREARQVLTNLGYPPALVDMLKR